MKRKTMITLALLSALGASTAAWAVDYPLPPANSRLIGQNQYWTVQEGDRNLQAIARHFDTAAMLILEANDTIAPGRWEAAGLTHQGAKWGSVICNNSGRQ